MSQTFLFQREETLLRTLRKTGELEKVCGAGGENNQGAFCTREAIVGGELLASLLEENDIIIHY